MASYAVGDLQGCLEPLLCLLSEVKFDESRDELWLAGDLVNRGPSSLETLRFVFSLRSRVRMVLGNHDLNLLAIAEGVGLQHPSDTLEDILAAPDRDILLNWLREQPLLYHDPILDYTMVHAGIPPQWSVERAAELAAEVEVVLRGPDYLEFLNTMYGNQPSRWDEELSGTTRLRVITNYLTRMRFCSEEGEVDLDSKTSVSSRGPDFQPWFSHPQRMTRGQPLIFGHWAALNGICAEGDVYALDTGCVWGRSLTMMRLEDKQIFSCSCAS
ncbi:MAG: bis(5'-nucleosyl)-tetraphosphatase (symmetrical) [Halieaceae bacterium]